MVGITQSHKTARNRTTLQAICPTKSMELLQKLYFILHNFKKQKKGKQKNKTKRKLKEIKKY